MKRRLNPPYAPDKAPGGATEPVALASTAARRRRPAALSTLSIDSEVPAGRATLENDASARWPLGAGPKVSVGDTPP